MKTATILFLCLAFASVSGQDVPAVQQTRIVTDDPNWCNTCKDGWCTAMSCGPHTVEEKFWTCSDPSAALMTSVSGKEHWCHKPHIEAVCPSNAGCDPSLHQEAKPSPESVVKSNERTLAPHSDRGSNGVISRGANPTASAGLSGRRSGNEPTSCTDRLLLPTNSRESIRRAHWLERCPAEVELSSLPDRIEPMEGESK